ncbi:FAD-dependent hydroxylase [Spirulina sp. CCNP1310]|uniref:FAD-dependent hydroxylase n=1 Tax=Spirulina sp. CCNP1310 TaxID=3110249 RepID=UPI002B1FA433|nr:FAD-dependent hydroxylase [Spirulina sp. CCNP1310]MEA5419134.1 FAD-dependent hydroxylase [Spirulina sp. CCNP1310]
MVETTPAWDCDLAIVGGGIVGATLAAALKDTGLRITIIEAQSPQSLAQRQRAYALSLRSQEIFSQLGLWPQILPQIAAFGKIRLSDADYGRTVAFEQRDLNRPALGYVGEHRVLVETLQGDLAQQSSPQVDWRYQTQVLGMTEGEHCAELELESGGTRQILRTRLVVGADGARSPLRQQAGIKTKGWKYWQSCVTFTIRHENAENDTAYERFWYDGPMGVLPLPGNRCQIVWTAPHAQAQALVALDAATFIERFQTRTQGLFSGLELVSDRLAFPVQLMQSDRYVQSRLALIGDAAHCCHPVGGQGLNLGIRDAAALAEILHTAHNAGEDIGNVAVLHRYERWRRGENGIILAFTDFLNRCFSHQFWPLVMVRRLGLWGLYLIRPLRLFTLRLMTGLLGRTPRLRVG